MCKESKLNIRMSISRKRFRDWFLVILINFMEILDLKIWRIFSMEFFQLKIYAISNTLLALNSFSPSFVVSIDHPYAYRLFFVIFLSQGSVWQCQPEFDFFLLQS